MEGITLLVSYYAQDPQPAIDSVARWVPAVDNVCLLEGRYAGFDELPGHFGTAVFDSEHAKRNELLRMADDTAPGGPGADRWLLIMDCDERVTYASPQLPRQLDLQLEDTAGCRAIEPLPPETTELGRLLAGLGKPGRSVRDRTHLVPRLIRHLPGLEYRHRHDFLVTPDGKQLLGWTSEGVDPPTPVDLQYVHLWWDLPEDRRNAKAIYYSSQTRKEENVAWAKQQGLEEAGFIAPPDTEWAD